MAGYSGTPLVKKLGIRSGSRALFVSPPEGFASLVAPLPEGVRILTRARSPLDFVIVFSKRRRELESKFARLAAMLEPSGMLWIAWPKVASGVATDLTGNVVRGIGLAGGLVDVKVCAIDEIWSGLEFVIRKENRPKA
ncbi:MAG TPA: DUF3052 domain-containing protein [Thermoanaerobaculia bacterium]|nr:DUF3052 domain-containing protein [Thermoanaerobaculia bacterium]